MEIPTFEDLKSKSKDNIVVHTVIVSYCQLCRSVFSILKIRIRICMDDPDPFNNIKIFILYPCPLLVNIFDIH